MCTTKLNNQVEKAALEGIIVGFLDSNPPQSVISFDNGTRFDIDNVQFPDDTMVGHFSCMQGTSVFRAKCSVCGKFIWVCDKSETNDFICSMDCLFYEIGRGDAIKSILPKEKNGPYWFGYKAGERLI